MSGAMDKLFKGIQVLIAIFLALMIALVFLNVVMRYVFDAGFAWSEEVARVCFIYLVYLGTIDAFRDNRHLGVEMLVEKAGPRGRKVMYAAIQLIIIWMMALLAKGSFTLAVSAIEDRWVATGYPLVLINGIGVVTGVSIILLAVSNLVAMFTGKREVLDLMAPKGDQSEEFAME